VTDVIYYDMISGKLILQIPRKMSKFYRVIFQTYEDSKPGDVIKEEVIIDSKITVPTNCLDFTIGIKTQLSMVSKVQSNVLNEKLALLSDRQERHCPSSNCTGTLVKCGKQKSPFHDVFTDHMVVMQRFKCNVCGHETPSTAKMIMGTIQSGELQKIQSELGARHAYREAEHLFSLFSGAERSINNHDRINQVTESVGCSFVAISQHEREIAAADEANELILNVDGGHIKTTEPDARSMEALASVIYRPEAIQANNKDTRNHLTSKNCAASILNDNQEQFISSTIIAALKQGLGSKTHVTALCDGAQNCWNVVEAIRPLCGSMTCILDWFHISMKMKNIALPEALKPKFLRVKWHLWRGNVERALLRLSQLAKEATTDKALDKINQFITYVSNNRDRIIDYRDRKKNGLVFTSNLAESTVESLINRRCKGQQHMRWSREGLDPLLQIRAALNSKGEWENKWRTAILNAS
jgi:hypothetical protein